MSVRAFTSKWDAIINAIDTFAALRNSLDDNSLPKQYTARWDTGATRSVICERIANELNLKIISRATVHGVDGEYETNCYYVDVTLPNNVCMQNVFVTGGNFDKQPFDMLIGMDIISMGGFAISNYSEETVFSYRIPDISQIDFTKHTYDEPYRKTTVETGRNEKCPCGSGIKYKYCCGK